MANKVGSIMARHNNANVEVAGIYNGKLSTSDVRPSETVDSDTYICFRADAGNDFVEECGNEFEIKNPQYSNIEIHNIGGEPRTFIRVSNTSRVFITLPDIISEIKTTGYTIDGIFYYPANKYNRLQRLIEFNPFPLNIKSYSTAQAQINATYSTNKKVTATISNDIFFEPFHCAIVHTYSPQCINVYFNGVKAITTSVYNLAMLSSTLLCVGNSDLNGTASDISCAFLRFSRGARWTANFDCNMGTFLYGFTTQNYMPIRHNNQTYYAPLISDANYKSSPCIAVRHNNQTYYTVK